MSETIRDREYYYSLINKNIEKTFSYEQRKEVKNILGRAAPVPTRKLVDFRINFWFIKRLYFVIFLGTNKRVITRSYPSKSIRILNFLAIFFVVLFVFFILLMILFCILYTVKSAFGLDLFTSFHLRDAVNFFVK
ncbi:MAG: hypothetical protein GY756_17115 [bacterium]|nr:hypothetical protein [bacterium]